MPPLRHQEYGWLIIDGDEWFIKNWHYFNDFGQTLETVTATRNGEDIEVYSRDEGETWVDELA